jgi:hypothetical protein
MTDNAILKPQSISIVKKDFETLSKQLIQKEKGKVCRILYCGPNFGSNGMAVFRIVEISRGQNYLEKLVFNRSEGNITSSMYYLHKFRTDRIIDAFRQDLENKFYKKDDICSHTLYREYENGHIRSNIIFDNRTQFTFLLRDFYLYWKLRSWARK